MPKRGGAAHNNKKHAKQPRHVPTKPKEPAGGWPDDAKVLAELDEKCQSTFGKRLRDFMIGKNSNPGTWQAAKQKNCTAPMARMCAAYVMTMCFGDEMVDTSIHCAWWWWPVGPIVSWWKRYGWGIWSGEVGFGKGSSGGVRPLMIALGYVGAVGAWVPGLALGHTATRALALFLGCRVELLAPLNLVMVPYYGTLISACFKALNLWTPLLRTSVACTKRGRAICEALGMQKASDTILSGLIFLSKTCMDNGIVYNLPGSWLGHGKKKKLKHRLLFVHPALPLVNNRIVYWSIPHDAPTLKNNAAAAQLFLRLKNATDLGYINVASSKMNPELAVHAHLNASRVNADILKNEKTPADRETCGFGCRAGFFELGQYAKRYGLVVYDEKGNATGIKSFDAGHFAKKGLPESKIKTLVRDRIRFDLYIKAEGWIELFKYIIENGVFKLKEGYDYVLEGLHDKKGRIVYSKIKKRLVAKPWASQSATLATEPLVVSLDATQLKAVEKAQKASWKTWYGAGWGAQTGNLATSLSKWHWWSWRHEQNMYPKEGELGFERPADAKAKEIECLGEPFGDLDEALEDEDVERDDELDGVGGAELSQEDVALVKAALDAAGETVDADVAALEAAATASDEDARSATADADAGADSMDVDAPAAADNDKYTSCFDLMRRGDLAHAKTPPGQRPCCDCYKAFERDHAKCGNCRIAERRPVAGARRSSRDTTVPTTEQRIQDEQVKACNLVMDVKTGRRPDGDTCWNCWRAVYHEDGCNGRHAVVGPDETPFSACNRLLSGVPYSSDVASAIHKLKYLEAARAAGNR